MTYWSLAREDERAQVDVAGRELAVAQRGRGGQLEDRLGDVVAGVGLDAARIWSYSASVAWEPMKMP